MPSRTRYELKKVGWSSILVATLLLTVAVIAEAQQLGKVHRIGFLLSISCSSMSTRIDSFRQRLRELGYVEGQDIAIEYRSAEGKLDRLPDLAVELVGPKVDVLVSGGGNSATRALKQATTLIPIVMTFGSDPVAAGFVSSLARPGGNVTGLTSITGELSGKRLELLTEMIPRLSRVGILSVAGLTAFKDYENAAVGLKVSLQILAVRVPNPDLPKAFQVAVKERVNAIIVTSVPGLSGHRKQIVDLAIQNTLPLMSETVIVAEAGGLASYDAKIDEIYRRAAIYVDKILRGTKPADLPVEQPTKFEFVVHLKTAKQIGLTIPPNVLVRADKVIK
jgi:putative tryptophan/tyrosine transport system substrate-binding protein